MWHSGAISNGVLEVGSAYKMLEARKLNGTLGHFSKNVVDDIQGSCYMCKDVHH